MDQFPLGETFRGNFSITIQECNDSPERNTAHLSQNSDHQETIEAHGPAVHLAIGSLQLNHHAASVGKAVKESGTLHIPGHGSAAMARNAN